MRRRAAAREPGGVGEVEHRVADRAELDPLVRGRQEAAAPEPVVERLVVGVAGALRDHDHEGRQVLVLAPQAVRRPGADAGPARELGAGLEEGDGRVVVDRLGVHRLDEAELVGHPRGVRQQLADARRRSGRAGRTGTGWPRPGSRSCRDVMPVSRWPIRIESGSSVPCSRCEPRLVDRRGPSATARRTGTGRSPAWPWERSWGSPRCPRRGDGSTSVAIRRRADRGRASDARAIVPSPAPVRPKKCRRVRCWLAFDERVHGGHSLVIVSSRLRISCAMAV